MRVSKFSISALVRRLLSFLFNDELFRDGVTEQHLENGEDLRAEASKGRSWNFRQARLCVAFGNVRFVASDADYFSVFRGTFCQTRPQEETLKTLERLGK